MPPPRPGYNRDGYTPDPGVTEKAHDPLVIDTRAAAIWLAILAAVAGFATPVSIILWRIAL